MAFPLHVHSTSRSSRAAPLLALFVAVLVPPLAASTACTKTYCDCAPSGLLLRVPGERAADVSKVVLTGAPCASATPNCISGDRDRCTHYSVAGSAAGVCHVEVEFKSGAPKFAADVTFAYTGGGCCGGFNPQGSDTLTIPSGPVGDAGAETDTDAGADADADAGAAADADDSRRDSAGDG